MRNNKHDNGTGRGPRTRNGLNRRLTRLSALITGSTAVALGGLAVTALPASAHHRRDMPRKPPLAVTVLSPGNGDLSGAAGAGFVIDLSIDSTAPRYNSLLSAANGYMPYFNDPASSTFHPGPDPGAAGLVVLLSTTPTIANTPFQGPNTNLAGLFQINGVAEVHHHLAETWNTWQVGKALFGSGPVKLTVYVVKGTAPAVVPATGLKPISNVATVPFMING